MNAPNDYNHVMSLAQQIDTNFNGRIDKQEMMNIFKRVQFQQMGWH